jgi:hypothetical protein
MRKLYNVALLDIQQAHVTKSYDQVNQPLFVQEKEKSELTFTANELEI